MGILKTIIVAAALLIFGKIGMEEYLRQDAMHHVVVNAYREHALAACRHKAGAAIEPAAWQEPSGVRLAIGKADLNISLWQTNHQLWNARYRNAYIYVTVNGPHAQVHCEYDITNDMAWVYQLGQASVDTRRTYSYETQGPQRM